MPSAGIYLSMSRKQDVSIVTMLVAVCDKALAELDGANPALAPLVTQLKKTRGCAVDAGGALDNSDDARAA